MYLFCIVYYICSYVSVIPQIVKLVRTKKSGDYSMAETLITFLGTICWSIYIFTSVQAVIVYVGTVADLVINMVQVFLIARYYRNK